MLESAGFVEVDFLVDFLCEDFFVEDVDFLVESDLEASAGLAAVVSAGFVAGA